MIEKERKFLLKFLPELGEYFKSPKNIKQGYLMVNDGKNLRIRIVNDKSCYLCFKQDISKDSKYEFEYLIPERDGKELYELAEFKLEKKRYITTFKYHKVEIDVYPSGLGIVEIEFSEDLESLPEYCGEEVTGINIYSNIHLAKSNIEFFK